MLLLFIGVYGVVGVPDVVGGTAIASVGVDGVIVDVVAVVVHDKVVGGRDVVNACVWGVVVVCALCGAT